MVKECIFYWMKNEYKIELSMSRTHLDVDKGAENGMATVAIAIDIKILNMPNQIICIGKISFFLVWQ